MGQKANKRRMAFYEIGRGSFAQQMQAEFEQAQIVAAERNLPVKLSATILISPPDAKDPRFGLVGYKIKASYPDIKSAVYTTEIKDGAIVADADDVAGLIQMSLDLPMPGEDEARHIPFSAVGDGSGLSQ